MNITESEQKIMKLLWEEGTLSTMQLVERLKNDTNWSKHAVISFLHRMEFKGLVAYEEKGRAKYYFALYNREDVAKKERKSFLDNFYHGKLGLLVSSMIEENSLSQDDIEDLREILEKLNK